MIFHITDRVSWSDALREGVYSPESLKIEGYIHCSFLPQVNYAKDHFFGGQKGLIVLCIDEKKLKSECRFEKGSGGESELFPHIYGVLNTDAVTEVKELEEWKG